MDAIATLSDHVLRTRWEDLTARAARTFILDSLGVGVAGSAGPWADQLVAVQGGWGAAADACQPRLSAAAFRVRQASDNP